MIVTIDGPAGAGKSTAARTLARRLGFAFLDTGAMYRAAALAAIRGNVGWDDADGLAAATREAKIELDGDRTFLDGEDVSHAIRTAEVTAGTRFVADHPAIRAHMVKLQRALAAGRDIVTEGRDQGTVVFPDAECKIFLTATPEERARRRTLQQSGRTEGEEYQKVLHEQSERDRFDESRPVGRLVKAPDAVEVIGDGLTAEEVVDRLETLVLSGRER